MIYLTIKIASTVPLPCLNPNWLFFIASSVFSFILFKIILLKTLPGIDRSDIALKFAGSFLSPFLCMGVTSILDQSLGVCSFCHIALKSFSNI